MRLIAVLLTAIALACPSAEASRSFTAASAQSITRAAAAVAVEPFSMGCWVTRSLTSARGFLEIGTSGTNDNRHNLRQNASAQLQVHTRTTSGADSLSVAAIPLNTWTHTLGVWASTISRTSWLSGVASTENTQTRSLTTENKTAIGVEGHTGVELYWDGLLSHCFIYGHASAALNSFEIGALAAGACPMRVRTSELVHFLPLYGVDSPEVDYRGFYSWTLNNAPPAAFGPPVACGVTR